MDILPRIGNMACKSGGKCTAYPTERRMLVAVERAVPWFLQAKNREKSCERSYFPVCSHLTRGGDRLKRLDGHKNGEAWECGASPFFYTMLKYSVLFLNVQARTHSKKEDK